MKFSYDPTVLSDRLNSILVKSGVNVGFTFCGDVKVGSKWCPHSRSFHVWIPKTFAVVIEKVCETFRVSGFGDVHTHDCDHLSEPGIKQINARCLRIEEL